jgi:hypothetical protein
MPGEVTQAFWGSRGLPRVQLCKVSGVRVPLRKRFGQNIATLRREAGMSQEAFADRCLSPMRVTFEPGRNRMRANLRRTSSCFVYLQAE